MMLKLILNAMIMARYDSADRTVLALGRTDCKKDSIFTPDALWCSQNHELSE